MALRSSERHLTLNIDLIDMKLIRFEAPHSSCQRHRRSAVVRGCCSLIAAAFSAWVCGKAIAAEAPPRPHTIAATVKLDYDLDIRPILSENCYKCHGFDDKQRMAGLRLDTAAGATCRLASGKVAVKPGDLKGSEIIARILDNGALRMPPVGSGKSLNAGQITLLKRWVREGGQYRDHWAFVSPARPVVPKVQNSKWVRNPIDAFVLARLEKGRLTPSQEADRSTLLRRLSIDLTGLPPTIEEQKRFTSDMLPGAYERVVDRLLSSPHYGERMAITWLDLARYADTHGYHIDSGRDMWRWRDWVIDAYNRNMPYDQFATEQLAGDLLPGATLHQKIATGFNRNHPIDFEGGAIPEEYAAAYIFDRIDTTSTAFMGLTMRCGQCHDHKYDPITQKDYYRFFAFFHNVPEKGLDGQTGNAAPFIQAPTPDQEKRQTELTARVADLEAKLKDREMRIGAMQAAWENKATTDLAVLPEVSVGLAARFQMDEGAGAVIHDKSGRLQPVKLEGKPTWGDNSGKPALQLDGSTFGAIPDALRYERTQPFSYGAWVYPAGPDSMTVISRMDESKGIRGWDMFIQNGTVFAHMIHEWEKDAIRVNTKTAIPLKQWTHLFVTYDGSSKATGFSIYVNGKEADLDRTHDSLTGSILVDAPVHIGRRPAAAPFNGMLQDLRVYDRKLAGTEVSSIYVLGPIRTALQVADDHRTSAQKEIVARYYRENVDPEYKSLNTQKSGATSYLAALKAEIPTTMVMEEMAKPRDTFILVRGQYDKPSDKVSAGTPTFLPPLPEGIAPNRLALARWLTSPTHPLTARVAVNRLWQQVFGSGIVRTPENFGLQGERPTHPELLDWLATEFIRTGWDQKRMLRLIVTSATYRQSSHATPTQIETDPENRLLARAPRYRLPAEMIRDGALSVAGLLVDKVGGPSVKPYQTAGLWEELAFGGGFSQQKYVQDHGESLYRRGLYTFWKRTCPPTTLQTFDAPDREFCIVRRSVTDTPLQALALMNDPTFVEAARKFAEKLIKTGGASPRDRINAAYHMAMSRNPRAQEAKLLLDTLAAQIVRFRKSPDEAAHLLKVGESLADPMVDPVELAAWAEICSMILNLDETITRS